MRTQKNALQCVILCGLLIFASYSLLQAAPNISDTVLFSEVGQISSIWQHNYFPWSLDSYWVYQDQDGNEVKRHAIETIETERITPAFSHQPKLEDWTDYSPLFYPERFYVNKEIGFMIEQHSQEPQKTFRAKFKKEMDTYLTHIQEDPESVQLSFSIRAGSDMCLFPNTIHKREQWDVHRMSVQVESIEKTLAASQTTFDYEIKTTGILLGTEPIKTPAGMFKDCLKVKYQTKMKVSIDSEDVAESGKHPKESETILWFARDVGVVKIYQKSAHLLLDLLPKSIVKSLAIPSYTEKTFVLKDYDIIPED